MTLEHTPALQTAFQHAARFAGSDQAAHVTPRHLLCGLLQEDEGKPALMLQQAGVDWSRVQACLGLPRDVASVESPELPLHPAFQVILPQARELAATLGEEGNLSTDHVLLAMLTAMQTLRADLEQCGLDFERLRTSIAGTPPEPLVLDEPLLFVEPAQEVDAARILDASANRAREALRVLEDFARFSLGDAFLTGQLKGLRHDLAGALGLLPDSMLLTARNTLEDVGTSISTQAEWERESLAAVVQANARRLQEALRSLEEYGKVLSVEFAQRIEKLRYGSYTLEGALVRGSAARERLADAQLCVLVTDKLCRASLVGTVKEAMLGGAQMIQLREKDLDDRALLERAREICKLVHASGALFIVNDRPDIARLSGADGVHLGQEDLPIHDARRIIGPDGLVGVSTHNLEQVRHAILGGADYLGVGPTLSSQTKEFSDFAGLEFVRQAMAETTLPAFAIGGINVENVAQVVAAGSRRIAVSHAVCAAEEPRIAARRLREAVGT